MKTLAFLLFATVLACEQAPQPPLSAGSAKGSIAPDAVVAEVDGKKITASQADQLLKLFPPQMQAASKADPKRALGYIMMLQYLADEAVKANLDKESPLKETLEFNRLNALSQAEVNQVRNANVKVEMEDEQKFYKEHPDRFQEAKVKVIYVAFATPTAIAKQDASSPKKSLSEAEAKAKIEGLRKQVQAGADFGKLAKENSDDKESAAKDGDFGLIKRSSPYPEPIKNAVFALKPGQVSEPVRQANGFYLLRLEGLTTQSYDQVRTQIYEELKQKGFNEFMTNLQKRYEVKVENSDYFAAKPGAPAPPPAR